MIIPEHNILLIILGIFIGVIGTLIGAGGGFILMPVLLFLYPMDSPETLTGITLAATFVNALSGTIAYFRMNRVNFRYGIIFSLAALPGAVIGAVIIQFVNINIFRLIFTFLLISISILIFFKSNKESNEIENNKLFLTKGKILLGIIISFFIGIISSFLGIGGGFIHVPVLSNIFLFPVHIATATSHFILSITSFTGIIVHILNGKFQHGLVRTIFISSGVLAGAPIGAFISSKIKGSLIIKVLSIALFFIGIRMIIVNFFY